MTLFLRLLPYLLGIGALAGVAAWIYDAGYDAAMVKRDAEVAAHVQRALEQAEHQREEDLAIAGASAEREVRTRTVYRTIYKEAEHVESPECRTVGPDFVRVFREAVQAAGATEASAADE